MKIELSQQNVDKIIGAKSRVIDIDSVDGALSRGLRVYALNQEGQIIRIHHDESAQNRRLLWVSYADVKDIVL